MIAPAPLTMPVLVVDDYNIMVRIVRNLLRQLGFQNIDEASDGKTALAKLRQRRYGLVISDWKLKPMGAHDLLGAVRADEALKNTPVVLMTPAAGNAVARDAGADSYLPAPFDAATLKQRLVAALGRDF
ncbi:MAG: response regulator [Alphaproteobacteria bacterium]|nr:response regulator [Alphaproteobacteria bacterium]